MSLRPSSHPFAAAALAAGLLAAPAAQARVADEGPRAITHTPPVTQHQDLRGEMARDAARPVPVVTTSGPLQPAPQPLPATDGDGPQTWLMLLGLTGAAIAAGGTAGAVRHRRVA